MLRPEFMRADFLKALREFGFAGDILIYPKQLPARRLNLPADFPGNHLWSIIWRKPEIKTRQAFPRGLR